MAREPQPSTRAPWARALRRRRLLLALVWVGATALGIAAAMRLPSAPASRVSLQFERPSAAGKSGGAGPPHAKAQAEGMRQQAESRAFLRSALERSGILRDPATRESALRGGEHHDLPLEQRIEAVLVARARHSIAVRAIGGSVFRLEVADSDPERARRLADALAAQFVESGRAAQLQAVRSAQELSLEQHRLFQSRLAESERRLEAFRAGEDLGIGRITQADVARARGLIEQSDAELVQRRRRVADLEARLGAAAADAARLSSAETHALAGQLMGLERQRAAAMLSSDPTGDGGALARLAMTRKLSELEIQLIRNAAAALPSTAPETRDLLARYRLAGVDLECAEAGRAYLGEQVGRYERLGALPADPETELKRLTEEVESNRALYNTFVQEVAASQIAQSFESARLAGRFEVLGPASLPRAPWIPMRVWSVLLALVGGGVLGLAAVAVAERRDPSVRNTSEVESLLGLPVLGAVPRAEDLDRRRRPRGPQPSPAGAGSEPGLLQRFKPETPIGLEFRRIHLRLARDHRRLPGALLITSSTRGEGKTLTAACLGITLARELRERTLLVDFDLRSPALHRALGLPVSSWGLAQILHQHTFDTRFVRSTVVPFLDFLPAGRSERPASDLLSPEAIQWFLAEARSRYARVVLDAAPSLAFPDSLILGGAVDGVLFVVKAGTTMRKAAEFGVKVQREARDNVIGVVVNDAGEFLPHFHPSAATGTPSEGAGGDS